MSPKVHQRITRTRIAIAIRKQSDIDSLLRLRLEVVKQLGDQYWVLHFSWFFYYIMEVKKQIIRGSKYRAMANTCLEIVWLRYLLQNLKVPYNLPAQLFCDNQTTLHIVANPVFHERTKHIEIDCHIVREKLQAGIISPSYVPTVSTQLADIFTKALGKERLLTLRHKLGVHDLHLPT